jgi:hypothetical protein
VSYIAPADIYAEGIDPIEFPAPDVQVQIDLWQEFIEHATGQFFEDRTLDFYTDGTGMEILHFQVPIVSLDELYINSDFVNPFDLSNVEVYNRVPPDSSVDDRKNPKIAFKTTEGFDIYRRTSSYLFARGKLNQRVIGHFGYLDNGDTPERIKWILKKLVINHLGKLGDPGSGAGTDPLAALLRKEVTDGHSIEYASLWGSSGPKKTDYLDVVQDPVINGFLKMFKAPRRVAMVFSDIIEPGHDPRR